MNLAKYILVSYHLDLREQCQFNLYIVINIDEKITAHKKLLHQFLQNPPDLTFKGCYHHGNITVWSGEYSVFLRFAIKFFVHIIG